MRVLVLGASGMLGHAVLRVLAAGPGFEPTGTVRSEAAARRLPPALHDKVVAGIDIDNFDTLARAFAEARPHAVVNCVGLVKQLAAADDPLAAIPVNALLPHRLARLCAVAGARLVHVSTDCVFAGTRGLYKEDDPADAPDLYGRSKRLGEVDYPHAVTLRTSIVGHELGSAHGLVEWFLSQQGAVRGFTRAVFSGLPTVELATVIRDRVLPDAALSGLYHVAAAPISKHDLLTLVASRYGKAIRIDPDDSVVVDRSLDAARFERATGYAAPPWEELVRRMHAFG